MYKSKYVGDLDVALKIMTELKKNGCTEIQLHSYSQGNTYSHWVITYWDPNV